MPAAAAPFRHLQALRAVLDGVAAHPLAADGHDLAQRIFPMPFLTAGALIWPWEHAHRVLHEWARWTEDLPEDVTTVGRLARYPRLAGVPSELRGRALVVVDVAIPREPWIAAGRLARLRRLAPEFDTVALINPNALPALHLGVDLPAGAAGRNVPLTGLPPQAVDAFLAGAGPGSGSNLVTAELRHRGTTSALSAAGRGATEEDAAMLEIRLDLLSERMAPFVGGLAERYPARSAGQAHGRIGSTGSAD